MLFLQNKINNQVIWFEVSLNKTHSTYNDWRLLVPNILDFFAEDIEYLDFVDNIELPTPLLSIFLYQCKRIAQLPVKI